MKGLKRRDLHRSLTVALALTTAALTILHFTNREKAVKEARDRVGVVHDQARNLIAARVVELKASLETWEGGLDEIPPGFEKVLLVAGSDPPLDMKEVVPDPALPANGFWVRTVSPESDLAQNGETTLTGVEYSMALDFVGRGKGKVTVKASLASPPAAGAAPGPRGGLRKKGGGPPAPRGGEPQGPG